MISTHQKTANGDIDQIKYIYGLFNSVCDDQAIPDFSPHIHDETEIKFNNESYNHSESVALIHDFCQKMRNIKVNILPDIECLDPENHSYLVRSSWEFESKKGAKGTCPMIEILEIRDEKIFRAYGVINMSGELSGFLNTDIATKGE